MVTTSSAPDVASRLAAIRQRIAAAAARAGRDPRDVTLVAVSKTFSPVQIRPALEAGVRDLGENRVQEAQEKVGALPPEVRWHLVGHLQRNKVSKALEIFSLIHSVDSVQLGEVIATRAVRRGRPMAVLLQVNVAQKEMQTGFASTEVIPSARQLATVLGLQLEGLMCIAPELDDVEETRPYFRQLRMLYDALGDELRAIGHPWRHVSMGMSNDYAVAVEEGATFVRIGRAIFGDRSAAAGDTGYA